MTYWYLYSTFGGARTIPFPSFQKFKPFLSMQDLLHSSIIVLLNMMNGSLNDEATSEAQGEEIPKSPKIPPQQMMRKSPIIVMTEPQLSPLNLVIDSPLNIGSLISSNSLISPTGTVRTADTCPLDLEFNHDMIHDEEEQISVSHRDTLDLPARRRTIRTAQRFQHWKDHSHAVGLAPVSWIDEKEEEEELNTTTAVTSDGTEEETSFCCTRNPSLMFCRHFQRIGNMVILRERNDWIQVPTRDDNSMVLPQDTTEASINTTGSSSIHSARGTETRFTIVLGPYWATLFGFTLPCITILSTLTGAVFIPTNLGSDLPSGCWIIAAWATATIGLYLSLLYTSMVDPGILPRYKERPSKSWRWNDQAQSYIPPDAVYEPDCKVVIEGYHHTCIYTGTAIGKNNLWSFFVFMFLAFTCLFMNVVLLIVYTRI